MRIRVIWYSQTGDSSAVAATFSAPFREAGHEVVSESIQVDEEYPYPWRNPLRFFSVLPECLLGPPPQLKPPSAAVSGPVELTILVYQVWFLSPSLPVQAFLASPAALMLRGGKVITVCVSRKMWVSASERMKRLLSQMAAFQIDNVAVTHRGAPWATFVTTPRALLWGKREAFWFFPPAGLAAAELKRVRRLGAVACERWGQQPADCYNPLLTGVGAVEINQRYLIPECLGWYLFNGWAHLLKGLGRLGRIPRQIGTLAFIMFLVLAITVGIPVVWLGTTLTWPLLRHRIRTYTNELAWPSGL